MFEANLISSFDLFRNQKLFLGMGVSKGKLAYFTHFIDTGKISMRF